MADIPKVCVITRTRNRPALLKRAIESVLAQTMPDWQHVIINDGGDVKELDALCGRFKKAYAGRLLVMHEEHRGMQQASNTAIESTESVYIAIHDDDDSWHPDFLKRTTGYLNRKGAKSEYQGVITQTLRILEAENEDGTFEEKEREPYVPLSEVSLFRVGYENPFPPIAFVYRRAVHLSVGKFQPQWDVAADLDFNFRFLQKFNIGVIKKQLAYYHWRDSGASRVNTNTVTAGQGKHAQYLTELKNHYLRQTSSTEELGRALSFNISAFLVDSQLLLKEALWPLIANTRQIQDFNDKALWPKLDGFAEAVQSLGEALGNLHEAQAQLLQNQDQLLQAEAGQETHLEKMDERLKQLDTFHTDALHPKLEGVAGGVDNIGEGLKNLYEEQVRAHKERENLLQQSLGLSSSIGDVEEQLRQLEIIYTEGVKPKLEEILPALSGDLSGLQEGQSTIIEKQADLLEKEEDLQGALERTEEQLGQIGKFNTDALWPKLDGFAEAISNLGGAMGQLHQDVTDLAKANAEAINKLGKEGKKAFNTIGEKQAAHDEAIDKLGKEGKKAFTAIGEKQAAQDKAIDTLGKDGKREFKAIREKQATQASQLDSIEEEIVKLREETQKQWQFGRFRIQWLKKSIEEDSSDSSS
jgi:glycosyltransferase involved in cell wall biosynthesis